jgi:hypothetical protein
MTNLFIDKLAKHRPNAEWIKRQSGISHLPLDIDVPVDKILDEWSNVKHLAVQHRDKDKTLGYTHVGWKSLTLYGVSSTITTKSDKPHAWTDIADRCIGTKNWLIDTFKEINFRGRIRFMLLEPGGHIMPHKDRETNKLIEVNIAISNPKGCEFYFENKGIVDFDRNPVNMLDLSNRHWVVNASKEPRLHMIYHGHVPSDIIERSYENLYYSKK